MALTTTTTINPNLSVGLQTIVIKPGETYVLPAGAIVQSLIYDGAINVTSSCDNLPAPEAYRCYQIQWSTSVDESGVRLLEHEDSFIEYIKIGNTKYAINIEASDLGNLRLRFQSISDASKGVFVYTILDENPFDHHYDMVLHFKTIGSIADSIEIKESGPGFPSLYVKALEENCP